MAERLKAAVLKTAEAQASVGSNPTPSARLGGDTPMCGDTPGFLDDKIRSVPGRNVPLGNVPDGPERCPRWPKEPDWKSRRWLNPASRVRIPPSPPRFSTTGDSGIRTEPGAGCKGTLLQLETRVKECPRKANGRWLRAAAGRGGRAPEGNPSLSAIAIVAFNLRPGEGTERKEEEKGEMKRFYLVFVAFLVFALAGTSCKKKEQAPVMPPKQEGAPGQAAAPHGMMGGGQEKKVVVPEDIKGVWTAVKIEVEFKEKKNKKQFTIPLNSEFKVPATDLTPTAGAA